jgi:response regulator NasT
MSEPQAFRWIQKTSMDRRLTMRKVAEAVIEGTMGTDGTGNTGDAGKSADAEKAD